MGDGMTKGAEQSKYDQDKSGLYYYDVGESGTIFQPNIPKPVINSDTFKNEMRPLSYTLTTADLINEVEYITPLKYLFQSLAQEELERILATLGSPGEIKDKKDRLRLKRQAKVMKGDEGWKAWVTSQGKEGLPGFKKVIEDWLAEPIDFNQEDYFPSDWNGMGAAKKFFEKLDTGTADALGVSIIEGEFPGSSYYAARLDKSVDDANNAAEKLGLPFRFRKEHE
jgi:hypothetical protein